MIDGPKAVGKTRSAERFAQTIISIDDEAEQASLLANFDRLRIEKPPVFLDEWQYLPEVWNRVRHIVDEEGIPGRFLLAGSIQSKNPKLHSGAGRIVRIRMRPLSLAERFESLTCLRLSDALDGAIPEVVSAVSPIGFEEYMHEIIRSGFPAIHPLDESIRRIELDSYIENISSRDFRSQGITIRHPGKMKSWMRAYAAATATSTSYNKMLDAATAGEENKPAKETVISYREALRSLWLIDDLPFWAEGEDFLGRLKQTPKHYLADSALEARLLRLSLRDLITGKKTSPHDPEYGSIAGRLFESLCVMSLRTYATNLGAEVGYVRTQSGTREIDVIVQRDQDIVAIEIKMTPVVRDEDVRHLNWFEEKVGDRVKEKIILTTGERAFRRKDRVLVIPAALFG